MSNEDGMLSQEEIDALLNSVDDSDEPSAGEQADESNDPSLSELDLLSERESDILGEIGNISFSNAATALSTLLNQKVEITTPRISYITPGQIDEEFPYPHVSVLVNYTEGFIGSNVLLIKNDDASVIADLMLGGDGINPQPEIGEIQLSAVQEAMNQMMGSSATSLSTMFKKRIDISPPVTEILDVKKDAGIGLIQDDQQYVKVSFSLKIGTLVDSNIMQLVPFDFAKSLVEEITNINSESQQETQTVMESTPPPVEMVSQPSPSEQEPSPVVEQHEPSIPNREHEYKEPSSTQQYNVQTASFREFDNFKEDKQSRNIDLLLDVPLTVTVELGRTKRKIKDILELGPGSVIELDKLAGEPVDVLINEKPIAKGEVVVIEENFGVRITEIINQRDRLQNL